MGPACGEFSSCFAAVSTDAGMIPSGIDSPPAPDRVASSIAAGWIAQAAANNTPERKGISIFIFSDPPKESPTVRIP
jgi:hypothetical protein